VVEAQGLTRRFGDATAVRDLSFRVEPGEILGLVGPNGAGKTTTLRCLAGILPPTEGSVRIGGRDLAAEPVAARRALAFMPDDPALFEYLTVEEHLRMVARIYGVAEADGRIDALLAELGLGDRRDRFPEELSRGMKQKLTIACGLLHDPEALLFDEPLTGLDPGAIRRMKATIVDRARNGAAVILSSHLLHLVEEVCPRILVIQGGREVAAGSVDEIRAHRPELEGRGLEDVFLALTEPDG